MEKLDKSYGWSGRSEPRRFKARPYVYVLTVLTLIMYGIVLAIILQ